MKQLANHLCHGGDLKIFEHESRALNCTMKFSIFLPPQAKEAPVPFVTFLSGLTCTHENFTAKANAYASAARYGLAIVAPDTSPRGDHIPDDESYDFGQGAGFYVNAQRDPWQNHFNMQDYIVEELDALICSHFPVSHEKKGLTGHSMGGHGALTLGLKYPDQFRSISAFSPIVAPSQVPWGRKAFAGYLGDDVLEWQKHDAIALMRSSGKRSNFPEILIDQGLADAFLEEQLKPQLFEKACFDVGQKLRLRMHEGYDHSYYFIQSFIHDHLAHHASILKSS